MNSDILYPEIVIAGCGNPAYADDGFGPEVADELSRLTLPDNVRVVDAGLCGPQFIFSLLNSAVTRKCIIIDSADFGAKPGMITLLRPGDFPDGCIRDSHTGGIVESLGQVDTGIEITIIGCQPKSVAVSEMTCGLSEEVRAAVPRAVRLVLELIKVRNTGPARLVDPGDSSGKVREGKLYPSTYQAPTDVGNMTEQGEIQPETSGTGI